MFSWDMVISKFIFTFPQIDLLKRQEEVKKLTSLDS
jgi:hypothetical protein